MPTPPYAPQGGHRNFVHDIHVCRGTAVGQKTGARKTCGGVPQSCFFDAKRTSLFQTSAGTGHSHYNPKDDAQYDERNPDADPFQEAIAGEEGKHLPSLKIQGVLIDKEGTEDADQKHNQHFQFFLIHHRISEVGSRSTVNGRVLFRVRDQINSSSNRLG